MSTLPKYIPHYTLDDYRLWEGNWELIDGVAIAMTPSPFGPHERIVSRLSRMIGYQIEEQTCACEVYTNLDWIVSQNTVIRPDLMVVCGEQPARHLERPPAMVAEVLSDSTSVRDATVKRSIYLGSQVPHYLIIDPNSKTIEHVMGTYSHRTVIDQTLRLECSDSFPCSLTIECARLFDS